MGRFLGWGSPWGEREVPGVRGRSLGLVGLPWGVEVPGVGTQPNREILLAFTHQSPRPSHFSSSRIFREGLEE